MKKDPSRLVNSVNGGHFYTTGYMVDLHNYPHPAMSRADIFDKTKAVVLGEFGWPVENHTWHANKNWGYQNFSDFWARCCRAIPTILFGPKNAKMQLLIPSQLGKNYKPATSFTL